MEDIVVNEKRKTKLKRTDLSVPEESIFYQVSTVVRVEEVYEDTEAITGKPAKEVIQTIAPPYKGTSSDRRIRKELKWKLKHTKLPQLEGND